MGINAAKESRSLGCCFCSGLSSGEVIHSMVNSKDLSKEKEFIDALRCRNGNLEIAIARQEVNVNEL